MCDDKRRVEGSTRLTESMQVKLIYDASIKIFQIVVFCTIQRKIFWPSQYVVLKSTSEEIKQLVGKNQKQLTALNRKWNDQF